MTIKLTEKEELARRRVCLALDGLETMDDIRARVEELSPVVGLYKIGMEAYTDFGPAAVKLVQEAGGDVFLDLKYGDIPNTVRGAARAASRLGVYMFNVHVGGGSEMLKNAVEGANEGAAKYGTAVPKVIGVTVLTSIDQKRLNDELRVPGTVTEQVLNFAQLSKNAGLDGIVCSAVELRTVKNHLPEDFMYVTPGIAGPNTPAGKDQARVFTPGNAVEDGSTILVIGRAITAPKTPEERLQAGYEVLQDMATRL